jgi:hypothetical protein
MPRAEVNYMAVTPPAFNPTGSLRNPRPLDARLDLGFLLDRRRENRRSRHAPLKGRSSGRAVERDAERMNRRSQDAVLDGRISVRDLLRLR